MDYYRDVGIAWFGNAKTSLVKIKIKGKAVNLIASSQYTVILGLGATGISVARHLLNQGRRIVLADNRTNPVQLDAVKKAFPDVPIECGPFNIELLSNAQEIIISPGLSRQLPEIQEAINAGIPVIGDIELFARHINTPVIAITGSNGKSTVAMLVGEMAKACGLKTIVAGNIGMPVLDAIDSSADIYVLELSSFQLESTQSLKPKVATILNVSADHMDRYDSYIAYALTKQRIAFGAEALVINKQDALTSPPVAEGVRTLFFTGAHPDLNDFGIVDDYLVKGFKRLLATSELNIKGQHNLLNAAAALALADAASLPLAPCLAALKEFKGLAHRCEFVTDVKGVQFINDSKATNVGATVAALHGLSVEHPHIHILLGGDSKGGDFKPLIEALKSAAASVVTYGLDGSVIHQAIKSALPEMPLNSASSLEEAVQIAYEAAKNEDIVLLSPACASLDMFKNFEERGECFRQAALACGDAA